MVPAMPRRLHLQRLLARRVAPLALALLCGPSWATPEAQGETTSRYPELVSRYLAERGLLEATPTPPAGDAASAPEHGLIDRCATRPPTW